MSLTQGKWSHEHWGYPVKDRPAGALLWAWFKENPDDNWKTFAAALGGITCSSLNFIDDTITAVPKYVFRPEGYLESVNATNLRLALLPGEAVCTENLTPWLKLLPCSNTGLSQLLKATSVFSSHFISIGLDVKKTCLDSTCSQTQLLLQQYVTVVMDPTFGPGRQDWNFLNLFGKTISAACPLASKSSVLVDLTPNGVSAQATLSPKPHRLETVDRGREFAIYDVKKLLRDHEHGNVHATYAKQHVYWVIKPPPITVHRYVQGYGLDQGGILAVITNSHHTALNVTYLEVIPWYVPN
ncbi:GPI transamidase component PIG-T-like [Tropilaelaps mercedesae]|uniref:GPI transamidase component PIG-T-like n=1 Tax=Tropilaelaps mercedesae TaxID=418985 RepID=A0A1V9X8H4_9ACAR|nr:GPI transamidase component PIG-T-like [Tropilaelaps mercedesae]